MSTRLNSLSSAPLLTVHFSEAGIISGILNENHVKFASDLLTTEDKEPVEAVYHRWFSELEAGLVKKDWKATMEDHEGVSSISEPGTYCRALY